jgi:hypothetical protein
VQEGVDDRRDLPPSEYVHTPDAGAEGLGGADMMMFNGCQVLTNPHLLDYETVTEIRAWRERLWSWPWRPWQRTKLVVRSVPSRKIIQLGGYKLLMHPAIFAELKRQIAQ